MDSSPGEGWRAVGSESRREFAHDALPHALLRAVSRATPDGERPVWRLWLAPARHGDDALRVAASLPLPGPLWLDLSQHAGLSSEAFARLPEPWRERVEIVHLTGGSLDDRVVPHLAGLTGLRELCLSGCPVTDAGIAGLSALPRLDYLRLAGIPRLEGRGLGAFPTLRWLDLSRVGLSEAGLAALCALPELERLQLAHAPLGALSLKPLSQLALRALDLSGAGVLDLEVLSSLQSLRELSLGGRYPSSWAPLGTLSELRVLDLSGSSITDRDLRPWPLLRELDLAGTAITDVGVAALWGSPLATLNLSRCPITDAVLEHLATWPSLRELTALACPRLTWQGLERLREARISVEGFPAASSVGDPCAL